MVAAYAAALDRQPLAASTRRAYVGKVGQFAAWLAAAQLDIGDPLADPLARDYAARDFKGRTETSPTRPRTINQAGL